MNPNSAPRPGNVGGAPSGGLTDQSVTVPSHQANEAISLAQSATADARERLSALLVDRAWLDRLDAPEVLASVDPHTLQLTRVLAAVAEHIPESLEPAAAHQLYLASGPRLAALIEASGRASRPGPVLVSLWRAQLGPRASETESTIAALSLANSEAGAELLTHALASPAFDTDTVIAWMRDHALRNRQNPTLLAALERALRAGALKARRRAALIEALFDYRPADWYPPMNAPPVPPRRSDLTDHARALLRDIADRALADKLIDSARRAAIDAEISKP